jgi:hypothetical protein
MLPMPVNLEQIQKKKIVFSYILIAVFPEIRLEETWSAGTSFNTNVIVA